MTVTEANPSVALEIIRASEIEHKEVKWLWYLYIPFGKVTLLQGDPGDGKRKMMLSLAALLSKGEALPFVDEEITFEPKEKHNLKQVDALPYAKEGTFKQKLNNIFEG